MSAPATAGISILGHPLELGSDALGELTASEHTMGAAALQRRLEQDGYLYLPAVVTLIAVMVLSNRARWREMRGGSRSDRGS